MSNYKATSWGRTRRPKNVNGNSSTAEAALHSTDGSAPTTVAHGYSTENQRYLHLTIKDDSAGDEDTTITVYVWHHAFQQWSVLFMQTGKDTGTLDSSFVPVAFGAERDNFETRIIEIAGADRVAFVADNTDGVAVYAACSTF
jgi:hypothetical protein